MRCNFFEREMHMTDTNDLPVKPHVDRNDITINDDVVEGPVQDSLSEPCGEYDAEVANQSFDLYGG